MYTNKYSIVKWFFAQISLLSFDLLKITKI